MGIKKFNEFNGSGQTTEKLESDNPLNYAEDSEKGFLVFVYKCDKVLDMSAMTSNVYKATLVGEGLPAMYAPSKDAPLLYIRKDKRDYIYASPIKEGDQDEHGPYMFGGNFVYSSDSRFTAISKYPIPVHDRHENWSTYHAMSRD